MNNEFNMIGKETRCDETLYDLHWGNNLISYVGLNETPIEEAVLEETAAEEPIVEETSTEEPLTEEASAEEESTEDK